MGEWRKGSRNGRKIRWSSDRVGSSPISPTMLMGVCNFNQKSSVIETWGANAYDGALCKGETN